MIPLRQRAQLLPELAHQRSQLIGIRQMSTVAGPTQFTRGDGVIHSSEFAAQRPVVIREYAVAVHEDRRGSGCPQVERRLSGENREVAQETGPVEAARLALGLAQPIPRTARHQPLEEDLAFLRRVSGEGRTRTLAGQYPRQWRFVVNDELNESRLGQCRSQGDDAAVAVTEVEHGTSPRFFLRYGHQIVNVTLERQGREVP